MNPLPLCVVYSISLLFFLNLSIALKKMFEEKKGMRHPQVICRSPSSKIHVKLDERGSLDKLIGRKCVAQFTDHVIIGGLSARLQFFPLECFFSSGNKQLSLPSLLASRLCCCDDSEKKKHLGSIVIFPSLHKCTHSS